MQLMDDNPYRAQSIELAMPRRKWRTRVDLMALTLLGVGCGAMLFNPIFKSGSPLTPQEQWRASVFGGIASTAFFLSGLCFVIWTGLVVHHFFAWIRATGPELPLREKGPE